MHSPAEAVVAAACDARRLILFFRSLLIADIIMELEHTALYEDNNGALLIVNAHQPIRRT